VITVTHRPGAQPSQIRAGPRLGIPLGPELLALDDTGQEALLLLLAAKTVDHRSYILDAERNDPRAAQPGQLVLEHKALQGRPLLSSVFCRPVPDRPALAIQQLHPLQIILPTQHL